MSVELLKKEIEGLCKDPEIKTKALLLDVEETKRQIELCENSIKNGNWDNYSENLQVRKQNLKELKYKLDCMKQGSSMVEQ